MSVWAGMVESRFSYDGVSRCSPGALRRRVLTALLVITALAGIPPLRAQDRLLPVYPFQRVNSITGQIRSHVVRDQYGFVWIGTLNGLCRYDGYLAKEYRYDPDDPYSLSSNIVKDLVVDRYGRLWVGTHDSGVSLYDRERDRFINFHPRPGDSTWYDQKSTYALSEDRSGSIWMASNFGGVVRIELPPGTTNDADTVLRRIRFTTYSLRTKDNCPSKVLECIDGTTLVASDCGVLILNRATHAISRLNLPGPYGRRLDSLHIQCMIQDNRGNIWMGTSSDGIFRIDGNSRSVSNYRHKQGDVFSLASDLIWDIAQDRNGDLWIGSDKGVDRFSPLTGRCIPYLTTGSMPRWPVAWMRLSVDRDNVLWVGTMDGGVHWLSPKSQLFPLYGLPDGNGTSPMGFRAINRDSNGNFWFLSSSGVLYQIDTGSGKVRKRIDVLQGNQPSFGDCASFIDASDVYWYGTWGLGLFRVDLKTGRIRNYCAGTGLGSDLTVNGIAQGDNDTLWVATQSAMGLMKFSPSSGKFMNVPALQLNDVFSVMRDRNGSLWLSSELYGVTIFDPKTGSAEQFRHNPADPRSLSNDHVRFTYQDSSGRVWVGAGNVINLWDPASRSFVRYNNPDFNKALFADPLGSDRKGRLWIACLGAGLAILDPSTGIFENFDNAEGIGSGFAFQKLEDGRVLLAQWNGVNIFNPDSAQRHRATPPVVITRMSINDEPAVPPRLDSTFVPLQLRFTRNTLEFEFAAIDIDAPYLVEYRYRLEGLEAEWVTPQNRRFVRYPGLSPGNYIFRVRAASLRGEWLPREIALALRIAPPWWQTAWAYTGYALLVLALLWGAYRLRISQIRLKQKAEMEQIHAEHLVEVDRLKSRFFANISHEFRTPLTLILGPIHKWKERLTSGGNTTGLFPEDAEWQKDLSMLERNAQRLLRLINQLLDLSKLEAGAMKLHASRLNIVPLVKGIAYSFESSAGSRRIALDVDAEKEDIEVYCDRDMVEKIISNLVSNAFKFTDEGGAVTVSVLLPPHATTSTQYVKLTVSDTGSGIAPELLDKIFNRFYQVEDFAAGGSDGSQTRAHEGSGIGLALVKELVDLHHGTIEVRSEVGKGTHCTVRLPLGRDHLKDDEVLDTSEGARRSEHISPLTPDPITPAAQHKNHEEETAPSSRQVGTPANDSTEESLTADDKKPIILVVEDNADVRTYIKGLLTSAYRVLEARDGAYGIEQAQETVPDLVISDVMMPKKDGYEVCKTLKLDEKTSHIPVILLTAKAGNENKIEGLETGADDYILKPFEPKELLARVKNLIDTRQRLRERFTIPLKPGDVAVISLDDAFLQKAIAIVEERMGDESFGIDELCAGLNMSRSQTHRKLTALTNQAPGEFIRYLRLHRAMDLLKKGAGPVAEIAYRVGFGDPSYFSRRFHQQFGMAPSEIGDAPPAAPRSQPIG